MITAIASGSIVTIAVIIETGAFARRTSVEVASPPRAHVSKLAIRHVCLTASYMAANPLQIRSTHRIHSPYVANATHSRAIQRKSETQTLAEQYCRGVPPSKPYMRYRYWRDESRARVDRRRDAVAPPVTGMRSYHFERFVGTVGDSVSEHLYHGRVHAALAERLLGRDRLSLPGVTAAFVFEQSPRRDSALQHYRCWLLFAPRTRRRLVRPGTTEKTRKPLSPVHVLPLHSTPWVRGPTTSARARFSSFAHLSRLPRGQQVPRGRRGQSRLSFSHLCHHQISQRIHLCLSR